MRHKIGDAVAEVARQYTEGGTVAELKAGGTLISGNSLTSWSIDEKWPELLQALFVASQSQDVGQRESAFRIFTTTPGIIEQQHENAVIGSFTKGFKDPDVSVSISSHRESSETY